MGYLQLISHIVNSLGDSIRSNISGTMFPLLTEPHNSLHGWDFQIHQIINHKLYRPSPNICIELLANLCHFQSLLNHFYLFHSLMKYILSYQLWFTNFEPSNWWSASFTIKIYLELFGCSNGKCCCEETQWEVRDHPNSLWSL